MTDEEREEFLYKVNVRTFTVRCDSLYNELATWAALPAVRDGLTDNTANVSLVEFSQLSDT